MTEFLFLGNTHQAYWEYQ